jgi:hypothetical protein
VFADVLVPKLSAGPRASQHGSHCPGSIRNWPMS